MELVNPYLVAPMPRPFRAVRAAAVALVGAAVVGGCGSTNQAPAGSSPTSAPTAAPTSAPAPAAAPAPGAPTSPAPPSTAAQPAPAPGAANAEPTPDGQYLVRRGDTLSAIAVRFKVKGGWPVLYRLNANILRDPDLILVGQKLRIAAT